MRYALVHLPTRKIAAVFQQLPEVGEYATVPINEPEVPDGFEPVGVVGLLFNGETVDAYARRVVPSDGTDVSLLPQLPQHQ